MRVKIYSEFIYLRSELVIHNSSLFLMLVFYKNIDVLFQTLNKAKLFSALRLYLPMFIVYSYGIKRLKPPVQPS